MLRPAELTDEEFDLLEENISRFAKGRAFLRRYARRASGAAAEELRAMVGQLRDMISEKGVAAETSGHIDILRRELMEMAASIERARREIAALRPPEEGDGGNNKIVSATFELDAIVSSTERASQEILNSAERMMDLVAKLRRGGADPDVCADIETEVTNIFTACSFQDLTGQRTSKVVNALRYIEQRVAAMIGIWGIEGVEPNEAAEPEDKRPDAHLLSGPQLEGMGVSQDDVDRMLAGFDMPAPAARPAPEPDPEPAPPPPPPKAEKKAKPKPAEPPPPPPKEDGPALDQSAIDALFG